MNFCQVRADIEYIRSEFCTSTCCSLDAFSDVYPTSQTPIVVALKDCVWAQFRHSMKTSGSAARVPTRYGEHRLTPSSGSRHSPRHSRSSPPGSPGAVLRVSLPEWRCGARHARPDALHVHPGAPGCCPVALGCHLGSSAAPRCGQDAPRDLCALVKRLTAKIFGSAPVEGTVRCLTIGG